ncbi:MAG: L-aspartate oxidase [Pseudomonadota bacterium]
MTQSHYFDVLILGSGAAGLSLALKLADKCKVGLLSKTALQGGSTLYAQGGIAAVLDKKHDSIQQHIQDTLNAGADLCHYDVVKHCVEQGSKEINWLIGHAVHFTHKNNSSEYHLTKEGGHSQRRVIHSADATGKALSVTLIEKTLAHPNIQVFENHLAIDLIVNNKRKKNTSKQGLKTSCHGIYVLNKETDKIESFKARFTALATGGASKVYLYTSNPDTSTGDGIAMAWRAGCRVANMEFNQFHPTCLYHSKAKSFLISEALRGEGAKLRLLNGQSFMHKFDPREELAPRDIVAKAIDYEMKRTGSEYIHLDISHKPADFIIKHFPNIYKRCLGFGIDITREPIPVVPAAHYTCGGVKTNIHAQTDIEQLYAIGETAFTGVHGANRMASNSLLECIVFAQSAADDILSKLSTSIPITEVDDWDESRVTRSEEAVLVSHNWDELRRVMWNYVGIVRSNKRLLQAKQRIDMLSREINDYYHQYKINNDLIELRNLVLIADLIIQSAMLRKESRGLHYTSDYPHRDDQLFKTDTILTPDRANNHLQTTISS